MNAPTKPSSERTKKSVPYVLHEQTLHRLSCLEEDYEHAMHQVARLEGVMSSAMKHLHKGDLDKAMQLIGKWAK